MRENHEPPCLIVSRMSDNRSFSGGYRNKLFSRNDSQKLINGVPNQ